MKLKTNYISCPFIFIALTELVGNSGYLIILQKFLSGLLLVDLTSSYNCELGRLNKSQGSFFMTISLLKATL